MEKNYFSKGNFGLNFKQSIFVLLIAFISLINYNGYAQVTANDDGPFYVAENASISGSVLGNDTPSGLTVPVALASEGVITMNSNGTFSYDATGVAGGTPVIINYVAVDGSGGFDTASFTINVVAGIIANTDIYTLSHTETSPIFLGNILDNDSSPNPSVLTFFAGVGVPNSIVISGNTFNISSNGDLTVTASGLNNLSTYTFQYVIVDGLATSPLGSVTVNFTNIPPVANVDASSSSPYYVTPGNVLNIPASGVLANDTDADLDAITAVNPTLYGSGNLNLLSDGSFTYDPVSTATGTTVNFRYRVNDNLSNSTYVRNYIDVVELAANDDAFAINHTNNTASVLVGNILTNDSTLATSTITSLDVPSSVLTGPYQLIDGGDTFDIDLFGNVYVTRGGVLNRSSFSFSYDVTNSLGTTESAIATINFTNLAPVAVDDPLLYVDQGDALSVAIGTLGPAGTGLLGNDSDPDGDSILYTDVTLVSSLTGVSIIGTNIVFDSSTYSSGDIVTIEYEISDGDLTDTASFDVVVDQILANKIIQTSLGSCNAGTIPASNEYPEGLYKIQYSGTITNPSYEEDMANIQLTNDLVAIFANGSIVNNAIVGIGDINVSTSLAASNQPWFNPVGDWDLTDIDGTTSGFVPQEDLLGTSISGNVNTNPGSTGIFLPASVTGNILRPRQTINFSYCLYIDPRYADDGTGGVGEGLISMANSGDVSFDNITSVTSDHGSDSDNVLIQDFHTSEANVAAKMFIPVTSPPVNSDGTYDFSIYVTLTNDSDQGTPTVIAGVLATNVQYYLPWEQFIHATGVTNNDVNLVNTSVVNFVSGYAPVAGQLNTSYNGDGLQKGILAGGTDLPAGETVVVRVDYNVGPTQDLGVSRTFETIGTAMSKGTADGLNEGDPATPNALTYVEWEDGKGVHVDRYYNGNANSITNPPTNMPASLDQCLCDSQSMSFDYGVYLTLEKTTVSDVPAASGTPGNRDVLFQLVLENLIFSTVEVDNLKVIDAISDICGAGNVVSVGTPQIVSSSATQNPNINLNYDGIASLPLPLPSDETNIFDNTSGILEPGQQIIVQILVELVTPCPGDNIATFVADDPNVLASSAASSSTEVNNPPIANNDLSDNGGAGWTTTTNVTVPVVSSNDVDPDASNGGGLLPSRVSLYTTGLPSGPICDTTDGDGDCTQVTVPGEGVWTVNTTTGAITFNPGTYIFQGNTIDFTDNPTPISYTLYDNDLNISNTALVTIIYAIESPVAVDDLSDNSGAGHVSGAVIVNPLTTNPTTIDSDSDGVLDATSVSLVIPTGPIVSGIIYDSHGEISDFIIQGEGTWNVHPVSGLITFTPLASFTNNPTPIDYNIKDNDGNVSNDATITIDYAPIATDDESLLNTPLLDVVINVTTNDTDGDVVDPLTVSILTAGATDTDGDANGTLDELVVVGEGTWTVNNTTGEITFSPCTVVALPDCATIFTGNPTDISYEVEDADGHSTSANVNIEYITIPPVANDDSTGDGITNWDTNNPVTVAILGNDSDPDGTLVSNTVVFIHPISMATSTATTPNPVVVTGEGTWTYDPILGAVTFDPESGFTNDPTPISYTVNDNDGNTSNIATVSIDYVPEPPTAYDDTSVGNPIYSPVFIDPFADNQTPLGGLVDMDPDGILVSSTVSLVVPTTGNVPNPLSIITDGNGDVTYFEITGEGSWQVNATTGVITFTPEPGFITNPTPVAYNVEDNDGNVSNDALVTIEYIPHADVQITKTDNSDDYIPGTTVVYTITVTNAGPAEATGVAMEDNLSAITGATVTWTSDLPSSGSGSVISDIIGTLAVASEVVYTVTVEVPSNFTGTIVNIATVTSTTDDPDVTNNTAADSNIPLPQAALVLTKTVDISTPNVGDEVVFTIEVTNNGPSDATGIDVVDNLPSGYSATASTTTTAATYSAVTGLWGGFNLANGEIATLTVSATVLSLPNANYINVAQVVKSDQADPNSIHGNGDPAEDDQAQAVTTPNQAPVAQINAYSVLEDATSSVIGNVITDTYLTLTDSDVDSPTLTVQDFTVNATLYAAGATATIAGIGTVTIATNGNLTFNPVADYFGPVPTITYTISDGFSPTALTDTSEVYITVTPVNDEPSFTLSLISINTVEDSPVNLWPAEATAISAGPANESGQLYTFTVTNDNNSLFTEQPSISLSGDLTYKLALNASGTATVSVTLTDDGGTANGGVNTSATQTFDIIINPVNDAPVLIPQYYDLGTITEDAGSSATFTVASIVGSSISDPDTGAQEGIAIYNTVGNEDWQFNIGSGWNPIPTVTVSNALLLRSIDQIRYSPDQENGEIATFSYFAWDDTVGAEGDQIDATTRGGTSAFSLEGDTATLEVLDVNDAPVLTGPDPTYTTDENTPIVFTFENLVGSSLGGLIGDVDNNALEGIAISATSATLGTLQYSLASGVWINFPTVSTTAALLLPPSANIKYIPNNITGETVTFDFVAWDQTTGTAGGTADVTPPTLTGGITAFSDNTLTATINVTTLQDDSIIALTKDVSAPANTTNYLVGEQVTFTIEVTNNGPEDATGIDVVDQLPSGYTFVASSTTQGPYDAATGGWAVGSLATNTTVTLTVNATINAAGNYTNIAEVTDVDQIDINGIEHGNNTPGEIDQDEVTITPTPIVDLEIFIDVDNSFPNTGDEITYTITVVNSGPSDATNVTVSDNILTQGLFITGTSPTGGTVNTYSTGNWNIGSLGANESATLLLTAEVTALGTIPLSTVSVTVEVETANETDSDSTPGNSLVGEDDQETLQVQVQAADLQTTKSVSNDAPFEGETIEYIIAVTNNGPSDATGISLNDLLPTGVTHIGNDAGGSYNSGDGDWVIGDLAVGNTVSLTISATVDAGTAGQTVTNTTSAALGDQTDPFTVNDTLSAVILVSNFTDIVLTKVVSEGNPNDGDPIIFTITVTNMGPSEVTNLIVTDQLPSEFSENGVTLSGGTWTSPNWIIGTLPAGITETLDITATVQASGTIPQTGIINTVSHTQDQVDANLLPDDLSETVTVTASDLLTVKSVSNPIPFEGETIEYTIAVTNNGPSDATGIKLNDLLPAGVTHTGNDSGGSYNSGDGDWFVGDLLANETVTLTIEATVDVGTAGQTVTNTTTAAIGEQTDPLTVSDTLDASITVQNYADVQVTKIVDNNTPNTGDTITFTITVTNLGPTLVTNLVIEDQMPTEFTIGNVLPTTGLFDGQYWTIGTLASGTTETLQIEALVTADGKIPQEGLVNIVSNTQDQIDLNIIPDDLTETVTITAANLVTIKTVTNTSVGKMVYEEGDTIRYTITVENQGPSLATGVSLVDLLPIGVTYVSNNTPGLYNSGDGNWTIGELGSGAMAILEIIATVDVGTASSTITNFTSPAVGDQTDPIQADDLEATIFVENLADIVITKEVSDETPNTGDIITYIITVTNAGPAEVTNLVLEDVLPLGITEVATMTTASTGIWSAPYWTIGTLASGTTETLTIKAEVEADGTIPQIPIVNTVSNTQDQIDSNLTPDDSTATVTVTASDLQTSKVVSNLTPAEGELIEYTISVTNNGPSPATGVSLIDKLPLGVSYVEDDGVGAYTWGDGDWTIGDLADGETVTLTISATVDVGTASSTIVNNTTAADGQQTDPIMDDVLQASITVQNLADIILTKVVDNETPDTGDIVTYTITITNAGPALVTGLVVEDILPVGIEQVGDVLPTTGLWTAPNWTIGTLATGVTETLEIQALVVAEGTVAQIPIVNTASHTQNQIDSSLPSMASASITVTAAELVTIKTVTNTSPGKQVYEEGDTIQYTISVENQGPSPATGVMLVDLLPIGVTYVSDDSDGAYNSGDGNWIIGDIASDTTETLIIFATVDPGTASTTITNVTTAAVGDQTDPDLVSDTLEAPIFVENYTDIALTKQVNDEDPDVGDTVTYTITVSNNGPATATNLVITDLLPEGLTFEEYVNTPSKGTWTPPYWNIGTMLAGESETFTLKATVGMDQGGNYLINHVTNTQDQVDSNLTLDDDQATVHVTLSNLVTVKTVSDEEPYEGDTIVYTIAVTNDINSGGWSDATNVTLTDLLPNGVTYVSHNLGDAFNSGSGIWTIGDLPINETVILEIVATVDEGTAGSSITNFTTRAVGDQSDPTTVGDDLEATINVRNLSDVVLTKVVDNPTPNTGDTVSYTITVTNEGPAIVTNLVVTDVLPEGVQESLATPSNGIWTAPEWTISELAVGVTETLVIEAVVTAAGTMEQLPITNVVSNTQDQDDSNLTEDDLEEDIIVNASDLVTVKTVSDETPAEGDTITYSIAVTNNGPSDATGVSLVDLLPIGVTYVTDNSDGAYNSGDGNWLIGELGTNETVTLEIMATVNEETAGFTVTNTTTAATGDQTDPIQDDDLVATIVVQNLADLVVSKTVDNNTPNAGDVVTYTITITNNGPADATNLVVTDMLPEGLTYGSIISPSIGTWTAPNWTIGTLTSGDAETIVVEAVVGLDQGGMALTNTVSNTQDQVDSNLTDDDASETIVVTSSDLETVKTVSNETPNEGTIITYTIAVTNNGPSSATNVSLIDNLPVGVTYVSNTTANGVFNFGSGEWNIGEIENGATATIEIQASVDYETVGQTITNTTSAVLADQSDSDITNNVGSVSIVPTAYIDLSLTKNVVGDLEDLEVGDMVTFEIRVANEGPTEATGVQVTDMIPTGYAYFGVYSSSIGTYNKETGIWDIGFIEIDNTAVLLVDVMVLDGGNYMNCAEITRANEIDVDSTPNNGDDTEDDYACASAPPVQSLDLRIEKTVIADNLTPMVGDEVSFEIRLINDGDIEGTDVVVTDLLPSGYTYLNYSSSRGTYDDDSGLWNVGIIEDGDTEILIVDAIVNATGDYLNCASITAMHQVDPDLSNNTSCIATDPVKVADLELTKDVDVYEPYAESNVDFTINLTNNGPSDASGVQVKDLLPSGYTFVSASTTVGTYDEGTGIWNVGNVLIDETETLNVTAYVLPIGEWTNVAEVIASNELDLDSTPGNNDIYEDDQDEQKTEPIVLLTIAEAFSPNGDGINDVFEIEFLEVLYPNFSMEIVDRYGNLVYTYKHNGDPYSTPQWWDGFSSGRMNFSSEILPAGTYFYTIYFNNDDRGPKTGWVYLRK